MESLTERAGNAMPLTDEEAAAYKGLHEAQIEKGKSKHSSWGLW